MMSPLALFLHADLVVKSVMVGLLLASVWTWAIIFTHSLRLRRINRRARLAAARQLLGRQFGAFRPRWADHLVE